MKFIRTNTGLVVIILAALLLELTTGILYYSAQNIIQQDVERIIQREMNALNLCIRNCLLQEVGIQLACTRQLAC